MHKNWAVKLASLACAATMAACGGTDGANDDRPAQAGRTAPQQTQLLTLSGCVQTAPGTSGFVLQNVRTGSTTAPQGDTAATPETSKITEGSWVRLSASNIDLAQYVGKQVSVSGTIRDDGRSTIGTSGASGAATPSGDKSQAASSEHHSEKVKKEAGAIAQSSLATGTAPEVQVQSVNATGNCTDQQQLKR
jgi:hypothetical protein